MKKQQKKYTSGFKLHPAPIVGIFITLLVLAFFNAQLLAALALTYVTPASAAASQAIVSSQLAVSQDPRIIMPEANIDAPVIYGMDSVKEEDVQKALEKGVLHFGGSPLPGRPGNSVFVGHSSNSPWAPGDYKFVFMMLEKLEAGNKINLNYNGVRYTYEVTGKKVVKPNDVSVLEGSLVPTATFITCTPIGTNTNRLVISAKLIDPEPTPGNTDALGRSAPELNSALPGEGRSPLETLNR